ncbi:unnamed protein product [Pleuronectes platessa]|uniref:Uncharacterized protein n=1 Tax=Pleuronectes platessa TaxID=8262 RepID=A0A9N7UHW8_PLEPL|nr:unnamed protein product [Pleuronectes platessa]
MLMKLQHNLRLKLRECKDSYRRKLEAKLMQNSMRDVHSQKKKITQDERQTTSGPPDEHIQAFTHAHCSQCFHAPKPESILVSSMDRNTTDEHPSLSDFDSQVRRQLERLHQGKAASLEFGGPVPASEPSAL